MTPAADRPTEGGDREGLRQELRDAIHDFAQMNDGLDRITDAILASDWLRDHDAAVRAEARRGVGEEWTVLGHPGWPGCAPVWRHREHAEDFLRRHPNAAAYVARRCRSEWEAAARTPGGDR